MKAAATSLPAGKLKGRSEGVSLAELEESLHPREETPSLAMQLRAAAETVVRERYAPIAPVAQKVEIVDVEPFASFAKVAVRSAVSGEARCLAQELRHGAISAKSFDRLASRFMVRKSGGF